MKKFLWGLVLILTCQVAVINSECSGREPDGPLQPGSRRVAEGDLGFYLEVSGAPRHYQPGGLYTVSLRVSSDKT